MSNPSSTNAVMIGAMVAVLVIGAFLLGMSGALEPDTPAEELGQSLESAAGEVSKGLQKLEEGVKESTGN